MPRWAAQELAKLGPITIKEAMMASLVVAALALWIAGGSFMDPAMVALAAISLMVLFSVIVDWDDIAGNRTGWNVFVTFATLLTMAEGLSRTGVIDWVGRAVSAVLAGHGPLAVLAILVVLCSSCCTTCLRA